MTQITNPTVLAALITGVLLLFGVALKAIADRAQQRSTAQADWQTRLEARVTKQDEELATMREKVSSQTTRIDRLEGELRDSDELIADMVTVVLWVRDGARPPTPEMTWRIRHYLRSHHPRPDTGPTPTQPPPSE